jgi:hypothetical protein
MSWWDQTEDAAYKNIVGPTLDLFAGAIPEEESLDAMIENYLKGVDDIVPRRVRRTDGFHASSVGNMCTRYETMKRALPRANDSKKFPASLHKRFQLGHAVHERWQRNLLGKMRVLKGNWECSRCARVLKNRFMPDEPCPKCRWQIDPTTRKRSPASRKSVDCAIMCKWPGGYSVPGRDCGHCERGGHWVFNETFVKIEKWDLVGSYDGIVLYNGVERILEMKSKDGFAFDKVTKPDDKHVIQAQVYMFASGVHEAVIAYISKNSGDMLEFLIKFDPKVIEGIGDNIEIVEKALDDGHLPNGVCGGPRDYRAKSCPYVDACFRGTDVIEELKEFEDEETI